MKILLADDSKEFRSRLARDLGTIEGIDILEAANGVEAMRLVREANPEVVVVDLNMPVMKGTELIEAIRYEGFSCHIIVLTLYHNERLGRKCLQLGADDFLDKLEGPEKVRQILGSL